MARTPRLTAAALDRSVTLADAASCVLDVLRQLHPHDSNLSAANRLFADFERDISIAAHAARLESAPLPEPLIPEHQPAVAGEVDELGL